jgi:hypothetical protein
MLQSGRGHNSGEIQEGDRTHRRECSYNCSRVLIYRSGFMQNRGIAGKDFDPPAHPTSKKSRVVNLPPPPLPPLPLLTPILWV